MFTALNTIKHTNTTVDNPTSVKYNCKIITVLQVKVPWAYFNHNIQNEGDISMEEWIYFSYHN